VTGLVPDISAVLAAVFEEAEAMGQPGRRRRSAAADSLEVLPAIGLAVAPFGAAAAAEAGRLEPLLIRRGISPGDRACLALAGLRRLPVLTADRAWATLGPPSEIRLLR